MSILTSTAGVFIAPPVALIAVSLIAQVAGSSGNPVLDKILETSPIGVACIIIVVAFLKHLRGEGDRSAKLEELRIKEMERIGNACHQHQQDVAKSYQTVVEANTSALHENTRAIGDLRRMGRVPKG